MFSYLQIALSLSTSEEIGSVDDVSEVFFDESLGDDKIVGGSNTTIQSHPYQLSLRRFKRHNCGASILTPTRALTAGQCFIPTAAPSQYTIMAGSTLRLGDANKQLRTLNRFLRHPRFGTPRPASNDIGILYWEQPLTFGANVQAIQLAPQNSPALARTNSNVTGWGRVRENSLNANILQVVTKPIVSNEECNRAHNGRITPDMLCAGLP